MKLVPGVNGVIEEPRLFEEEYDELVEAPRHMTLDVTVSFSVDTEVVKNETGLFIPSLSRAELEEILRQTPERILRHGRSPVYRLSGIRFNETKDL